MDDQLVLVHEAAADEAGGAFARTILYTSPYDHRLSHVLANGVSDTDWAPDGLSLDGAGAEFVTESRMIADNRGGCFVSWEDHRAGGDADIYALRIARNGTFPSGWPATGLPMCVIPGSAQTGPHAAADSTGNVFVVWRDDRQGPTNVYAQRLSPDSPVPTTVQRAFARYADGRVTLTWELAESPDPSVVVERSVEGIEWTALGSPVPVAARDHWAFVDEHPPGAGSTLYRLHETRTGWTGGEVEVTIPGAVRFALSGPLPNPWTPGARFMVNASVAQPIELVVTDLLEASTPELDDVVRLKDRYGRVP